MSHPRLFASVPLGDPSSPLFSILASPAPVLFRESRELFPVRPQHSGSAQVDVDYLPLGARGVPVDQHADALGQRACHVDLLAAEQRRVDPSQIAGGPRRKNRIQVGCGAEEHAGYIFLPQAVRGNDRFSNSLVAARIASASLASTVVAPRIPLQYILCPPLAGSQVAGN